jgi:hypothetical protein
LLVSTLVPYPSWGTIFVRRPYFTLFLSTKKFVAGQIKNIVLPPPPPLPPHRTKYSSLYVCRIYWFLMSSIFCPYWIPWVNVDIVRWCCNWILLNIFRAQTINQIQSAIYAINQNISSNNRQCIKSYSSHKWKQTKFSKTEYLEIFLQLKRTSNHTLLTNENRQTFPKQNILKFFFN